MADIEKERMRAALKLISEKSCERLTTGPGSCWSQPAWTPEAQYSDDRWCDGCIALAGLLPQHQIPASAVIMKCDVKLTASDIDGLLRHLPAVGTVTLRPSEVLGSQEPAE